MRFELRLCQGYNCSRCGEFFTSETLDEKRAHVALFGMTDQVCPICYSTPEERDGKPLPPPPPMAPAVDDEEGDDI
jgi:hypothetical protein